MNRSRILLTIATLVALFTIGAISSCNNKEEDERNQHQLDSLSTINAAQAEKLNELDETLADVLQNFMEINSMEGSISLESQGGELGATQKQKIEDNILLIKQKLQRNKENLDKLNRALAGQKKENKTLAKTISTLQSQLTEKNDKLVELVEELRKKNIVIEEQAARIGNLEETTTQLQETTKAQEKQIDNLYLVKYCIGTGNDLKEMRILRNGQIMADDYNQSYFTTIDLRKITNIPLVAKRAELLTKHPSSSYSLVAGEDKLLTLEIKNPQEFWSLSKVLVVRVR